MSIVRRILNLFRDQRVSRDIDREIRFHITERADDLIASGYDAHTAMREARRRFGNDVYQKEETRHVDLMTSLDTFVSDIRYALRTLVSSPLFALISILSLALGIGANTAIFSLINAVMLKTLPVSHPEQLVQVTFEDKKDADGTFTNPLWEALRDRQDVFSGVFAYGNNQFNLAEGGEAREVPGSYVSGDFFRTLAVRPETGRLLSKSDDFRGCSGAAVIGYGLWQREFGGDANILGRMISLNGHRFPIVGVADRKFYGIYVGTRAEAYLPLCAEAVIRGAQSSLDRRSNWWLRVMGRPLPDREITAVKARLRTLSPGVYQATIPQNWGPAAQADYAKRMLYVQPAANGISYVRETYSTALLALMVIVGVVLLIACANVANLLLARATSRQREVAVRLALGAGRGRLIRQLLTESLVLSTSGAVVGVLFARWGSALLVRLLSEHSENVSLDLTIDKRVLVFTILVTMATGILFGLAPAWRSSRVQPQAVMKAAGRSIVEGHSRFSIGKALVIGQIGLSLILVMGASLLLASFRSLATMDTGFVKDGVLIANVNMSATKLQPAQEHTFYSQLLDRSRSLAGVRDAAISSITPISGSSWNELVVVRGFKGTQEDSLTWMNEVSGRFFSTYGMQIIGGRDFNTGDAPGSPNVVIVNEAFAKKYWGTTNVVGKEFALMGAATLGPSYQIVGVVTNSKYNDLKKPMESIAYESMSQDTAPGRNFQISFKTNGDFAAAMRNVKAMANEFDPASSLEFEKLDTQITDSIQREKLLATLSGFFGALALILAMIGLYGIMAYNVARRRGEIGIRMALGSERGAVIGMVLREVGGMVIGGLVLGTVGILGGMKLLGSLLYGFSPTDPRLLLMSAIALAIVAITAGAIPAWRAGRIDPMDALRDE